MTPPTHGETDGDRCNRDGCTGVIELTPLDNCSCHIDAPCYACMNRLFHCPACGWEACHDSS